MKIKKHKERGGLYTYEYLNDENILLGFACGGNYDLRNANEKQIILDRYLDVKKADEFTKEHREEVHIDASSTLNYFRIGFYKNKFKNINWNSDFGKQILDKNTFVIWYRTKTFEESIEFYNYISQLNNK